MVPVPSVASVEYGVMRIDRAGWPFVLGALVPAAIAVLAHRPWWALPFLVLAAVFLFFFRDPHREIAGGLADVLSPADGRVLIAGDAEARDAPPGEWRQVSIFLSPLDVHVNRVPISGRVVKVEYRPGRFLPAYRPDAASANERTEMWIDHHGIMVVCRQVVGLLARRIVCRVKPGEEVRAGARFGVMKFGSRMDLFLPLAAELRVAVGDRVRAGVTVIAVLPEQAGG
jgi:phosphatidylserine decarboxylase